MPGINGKELCKKIREINKEIIVVCNNEYKNNILEFLNRCEKNMKVFNNC